MIGLGLRLATSGGREGWTRLITIGAGVMIGAVLLLTAVSGLQVLKQSSDTPCWRCSSYMQANTLPDTIDALPRNALLWGRGLTVFNGEYIDQFRLAAVGSEASVIPGINRTVQPGEYFVSPALAELIRTTPADQLGNRFPGKLAGEIGAEGLSSPSDMVVVIGVEPAQLFKTNGTTYVTELYMAPEEKTYDTAIIVMFLVIVGGLLFAIWSLVMAATRLGAARREEKFATLRLFGATPRQISKIAAVDAALGALIGSAAGLAVFFVLRPLLATSLTQVADIWPHQFTPGILGVALVVGGTLLVSIASALLSLRRVRLSPLGVTRKTTPKPPGAWRIIPLLLGFGILIVIWLANKGLTDTVQMARSTKLFVVGFGLVLVGIALIGPWLTQQIARLFARLAIGAPSLLAARQLADKPKAAFRSVGVLVIAAFLATMMTTFAPLLRYDIPTSVQNQLSVQYMYFIDENAIQQGGVRLADVAEARQKLIAIPGVAIVPWHVESITSQDDMFGKDTYARCADLQTVRASTFPAAALCEGAGDNAVVHVPAHSREAAYRYEPRSIDKARLITKDISDLPLHSFEMVLPPSQVGVERVRTIIAQTPEMSGKGLWSTPAEMQAETERMARNVELAVNGILLIILFVAGCSLAVSAGGAIMERKRPFGLLRVAGMSIRQLRRVVLYESALPLLASTVLASVFGFLVAVLLIGSFTHPSDRTIEPPTLVFYGIMAAGICLALLAILATMPLLNAVTKPDKARFE